MTSGNSYRTRLARSESQKSFLSEVSPSTLTCSFDPGAFVNTRKPSFGARGGGCPSWEQGARTAWIYILGLAGPGSKPLRNRSLTATFTVSTVIYMRLAIRAENG